ncbi:hypothetical protein THAOC_04048 [Thalassiosira oceanica]|uniref:Uncharacterized protein n=1 Tax=Thalassiosira oceanica TaxID=159749 RepID=K0TP96_THAOC|nr:hypothetical protein THAOC_04048 [Thalassiosira oceanica]|eukprot:EJK74282.1 hypothetical protein THAOC_04048 [Thalassiosira oceanica]
METSVKEETDDEAPGTSVKEEMKEETDDEAPVPMETEEIAGIKAEDAPSSAEAPPDAEARPDEAPSGGDQAAEPAGAKSETPEETPPETVKSDADGDAAAEGAETEDAEDGGEPSTDPTGRFKRPTPSSLREWEHFETVDDDVAQIRLARAMGYPPSWRVIRCINSVPVPHFLAPKYPEGSLTLRDGVHWLDAVSDRIYAGPPDAQPDGYYNHAAAYLAASRMPWFVERDDPLHDREPCGYRPSEYCATSHRSRGGQIRPREAKFDEGDVVEVLYDEDPDEDPEWYEATVTRRTMYSDDIQYSVHYHLDDTTQTGVRENKLRPSAKAAKKKAAAARKKASSKAKSAKSKSAKSKSDMKSKSKGKKSDPKKKKADAKKKTKKETPKKAVVAEEEPEEADGDLDDDPPWRTDGHEHIGRRVRWTPPPDFDGGGGPVEGTVTGWISETDRDSEGNPGFVSERTGRPASLYHAEFDEFDQDFEEWELEDCFV